MRTRARTRSRGVSSRCVCGRRCEWSRALGRLAGLEAPLVGRGAELSLIVEEAESSAARAARRARRRRVHKTGETAVEEPLLQPRALATRLQRSGCSPSPRTTKPLSSVSSSSPSSVTTWTSSSRSASPGCRSRPLLVSTRPLPTALSLGEQPNAIRARVLDLTVQANSLFGRIFEVEPASAGIKILDWHELKPTHQEELRIVFESRIFPVLTPLAVDPAHPFPYISNLSLNLAVVPARPLTACGASRGVKVPPLLPRFSRLGGAGARADRAGDRGAPRSALPGHEDRSFHVFRSTRDADFGSRSTGRGPALRARPCSCAGALGPRRCGSRSTPRCRGDARPPAAELGSKNSTSTSSTGCSTRRLWSLAELRRPALKTQAVARRHAAEAWPRGKPAGHFRRPPRGRRPRTAPVRLVLDLGRGVRPPGRRRPGVLAIKQTLYRTSDEESPIVQSLIAPRGRQAGRRVIELTRHGSTRRRTSPGRGNSSRRACTSSTASSA